MTHRPLLYCLLALGLSLPACGKKQLPPTAADLIVQKTSYALVKKAEQLTLIPDPQTTDPSNPPALDVAGLVGMVRYSTTLGGEGGGTLRVKGLLFSNETAAAAHWDTRHSPQALSRTQPLKAGDAAWIYETLMSSVRKGRVIYEIRAKAPVPQLPAYTQACAAHAADLLQKNSP